jgi:hypothetical protein
MGSGNYPVKKWNKKERELLDQAIKNIDEVLVSLPADDNQYDNAEQDGAYRYRLELAQDLINECME